MKKIKESEHPFPNKEMYLLMKLNKNQTLNKEDFELLANLLRKYLDIRSHVFHQY